mgnify:CR=1 FL=1
MNRYSKRSAFTRKFGAETHFVIINGKVDHTAFETEKQLSGIAWFHKYVFHAASNVEFALASLGNDAGAYGAFKLALDAFGA